MPVPEVFWWTFVMYKLQLKFTPCIAPDLYQIYRILVVIQSPLEKQAYRSDISMFPLAHRNMSCS
jgi:hypothetical protein